MYVFTLKALLSCEAFHSYISHNKLDSVILIIKGIVSDHDSYIESHVKMQCPLVDSVHFSIAPAPYYYDFCC